MPGYYVGHGRHWDFFRLGGVSNDKFMSMLYESCLKYSNNVLFQSGDLRLICEPQRQLAIAVLISGNEIVSAFPYASGGHVWPIEVKDVYEWPTAAEGQLLGSCHGARIGWFDLHYGQNSHRYRDNHGSLNFEMNALAYDVWPTQFESSDREAMMGNMKAYMPLADDGEFVASEDELQFVSHVEEVEQFDFHGVPFFRYTVTIALPDDFPMRLNVHVPFVNSGRAGTPKQFSVGERISGACWVFGRLIDS